MKTYNVPDISCDHCVAAITEGVKPIAGVERIEVDLESKTVSVVGGDDASIIAAIDEAGYDIA
ncbi:MAG: heavy-metal-associated domain-containing protein [Actinomycetia bacterium]|nr:heavy-metal-associated domain-containing protein [Actinomycetes bacterium]MCP5031088.1 heavy-metal-associated domain-containing protein [Actinomycetes bacterium]